MLRSEPLPPVPAETARIARACPGRFACPTGGTVKLSTFDGSDDRKVGSNPRLRAMISLQAQHLRAIIRPRWGGFVQLKLNVTVPHPELRRWQASGVGQV